MTDYSLSPTYNLTGADDDQLSLGKAIALHLLPGLAIVLTYIILAQLLRPFSLPSLIPMLLAVPITLVPVELGYLLIQGKKRNGRYSLKGIIHYRQPLSIGKFIGYTAITLVSMMALFIALSFTDSLLLQHVFGWWPTWLMPDYATLVQGSNALLITGIILTMLFANIVAPTIEELYFRGYLLPRMAQYGRFALIINSTLFALYHFWSPWGIISRAIAILPLGIAARKGNIYIPIVAHCLINTIGLIMALGALLAQ